MLPSLLAATVMPLLRQARTPTAKRTKAVKRSHEGLDRSCLTEPGLRGQPSPGQGCQAEREPVTGTLRIL